MSDPSDILESIRRLELEMAQQLDVAHDEAQHAVAAANRDAAEALDAARRRGRETARRAFADAVAAAEAEAKEILAEGDARAAQLAADSAPYLDDAAAAMMDLLLAPPLEEGK